ncbi:MAG: hypothetical protein QXJ55_06295 [Candidatus Caldarchaeum sp.]
MPYVFIDCPGTLITFIYLTTLRLVGEVYSEMMFIPVFLADRKTDIPAFTSNSLDASL